MAKHEYRILSRRTEGGLAAIIEDFMNDGWQLAGGVFVHETTEYAQAQGYDPVAEKVTKFYQAITRLWNPVPRVIGKVVTANEEVLLYSEN
jgi:hypothetical protein